MCMNTVAPSEAVNARNDARMSGAMNTHNAHGNTRASGAEREPANHAAWWPIGYGLVVGSGP